MVLSTVYNVDPWARMNQSAEDFDRAGRPIRCFPSPASDLSYVSWGIRRYGETPVKAKQSPGWHYFVSLTGSPFIVVEGREIPMPAGSISIADPTCRIGHIDHLGHTCEMLTWIWREPPPHSALIPGVRNIVQLRIDRKQLGLIKKLHGQTRAALAEPNETNRLRLRASHMLLDLCIFEGAGQKSRRSSPSIDLALEYIRAHLDDPSVVEGLRDHLRLSKASLYRLFQQKLGKCPRACVQALRMEWAREELGKSEVSIKAVAFALGYRYAPDFSRAFKQHFGITASEYCGSTAGSGGALR